MPRLALPGPLTLLLLACVLAPAARAQDLPLPGEGFEWERVGDRGLETDDLVFDRDATLWAAAALEGTVWPDLSGSFSGTWVLTAALSSPTPSSSSGRTGPTPTPTPTPSSRWGAAAG